MALTIIILFLLFLGGLVLYLYGKENFTWIVVPLIILLLADFLILYGKFIVPDYASYVLHHLLLYFSAGFLLFISVIWFVIHFIAILRRKATRKRLIAVLLVLMVSLTIPFIPAPEQEDAFTLYQDDFYMVADAIFEAYDNDKIQVEERIHARDLDRLEEPFSKQIVQKMQELHRDAEVFMIIMADKDVIYFANDGFFQSIKGIAITRNGKDPNTDEALKARFFDGSPNYKYIERMAPIIFMMVYK
jgi:hypothetical protein